MQQGMLNALPAQDSHQGGGQHQKGSARHRPSVVQVVNDPEEQMISLASVNCTIAQTPFPITTMKPFAPFHAVPKNEPFVPPKTSWRGVVQGIRAIQALRDVSNAKHQDNPLTKSLRPELIVITGHEQGHLVLWNAENLTHVNATTHYNQVTVSQAVVGNSNIFTLVERDGNHGKVGDDTDIYVWDMTTMHLTTKLQAHEERVTAIVLDEEDADRLITGGADRAIYIWNMQHLPAPVAKIAGPHTQASILKLILFRNCLVAGTGDGVLKIWDITNDTEPKLAQSVDQHAGAISFLGWHENFKEARKRALKDLKAEEEQRKRLVAEGLASESQSPSHRHHGNPQEEANQTPATFISGCNGGALRLWNIDPHTLQVTPRWMHKPHRAFLIDVTWDGPLIFSSSIAEGTVNISHMGHGTHSKVSSSETGVRHLAVDPVRKLLVAGSDSGLVTIWNYEGFYNNAQDPALRDAQVTIFAALQPHLGAIRGIILERSPGGTWERMITASKDQSVFVLDFNVSRDAKVFQGHGTKQFAYLEKTGDFVAAHDCSAGIWDPDAMVKKQLPRGAFEGHSRRVTAMTFSNTMSKIITGAEDAFLRTWDVLYFENVDDQGAIMSHEEAIETADCVELTGAVRCMSQPQGSFIAVGTQKLTSGAFGPGVSKTGHVEIVDFCRGALIATPIPMAVYPVSIDLHLSAPEGTPDTEHSLYLVITSRSGEIFTTQVNGLQANTPPAHRTVQNPPKSIYPEQFQFGIEHEATAPMPINSLSFLDTRYMPPKINLIYVDSDRQTLKSFDVSPFPGTRDPHLAATFTKPLPADAVELLALRQAKFLAAIALDSGATLLVTYTGEIALEVRYDGSVIDYDSVDAYSNKVRRSFIRVTGQNTTHPGACALSLCPEQRVLGVGYRDGVINLFDIATRRVCRRICAHSGAVMRLFVLPHQRIVSSSVMGAMRIDPVYGRNIRDSGNSKDKH